MPNFLRLQAYQGLAKAPKAHLVHNFGPLGHQFGIIHKRPRAPPLIVPLHLSYPTVGRGLRAPAKTQRPLVLQHWSFLPDPVDLSADWSLLRSLSQSAAASAWCTSCRSHSYRTRRPALTAFTPLPSPAPAVVSSEQVAVIAPLRPSTNKSSRLSHPAWPRGWFGCDNPLLARFLMGLVTAVLDVGSQLTSL